MGKNHGSTKCGHMREYKNLDPAGRYLVQKGSNSVFVWTKDLAKRDDMDEIDPATMERMIKVAYMPQTQYSICDEIYFMEDGLGDIFDEMLAYIRSKMDSDPEATRLMLKIDPEDKQARHCRYEFHRDKEEEGYFYN